jgi:uncharacterized CHY-type Zn-finger protein
MKNEKMQKVMDEFSCQLFGRSATDAKAQKVCVICGKTIEGFRNSLSMREYEISGMCQDCQDNVFDE